MGKRTVETCLSPLDDPTVTETKDKHKHDTALRNYGMNMNQTHKHQLLKTKDAELCKKNTARPRQAQYLLPNLPLAVGHHNVLKRISNQAR